MLRDVFDRNGVLNNSFASYLGSKTAANDDDEAGDDDEDFDDDIYEKYAKNSSYPSYQYYEDAEKEEVPIYMVELARSERSKCTKCKNNIPKQGIRVGSLIVDAGTYGRWNHLECWRVPVKVQ